MNQVVIPFRGWDLPAWANSQPADARIAIKPICDHIGIDWPSQYTKLTTDPSFKCCDITMVDAQGVRKALTLPVLQLNRWLCGINANRVKPEIAPKLLQFQDYCMWAIYDALSGRVNPTVITELEETLKEVKAELAIMRQENQELRRDLQVVRRENSFLRVQVGPRVNQEVSNAARTLRNGHLKN